MIVSDDMSRGGVGGFAPRAERVVGAIKAGCDMYLFPALPKDFDILVDAYHSGKLDAQRLDDACRRVLQLKARLGLAEGALFGPPPSPEHKSHFSKLNQSVATKSLCLVRDIRKQLPLKLRPGARVLTATMSFEPVNLQTIDEQLRKRGCLVTHIDNPSEGWNFSLYAAEFDATFINCAYIQSWGMGSVRPCGPQNRIFFNGLTTDVPHVIFTSFGSPYLLRYFRGLPNLINAFSISESSQKAAVAAWFGEIAFEGKSPVANLFRQDLGFSI